MAREDAVRIAKSRNQAIGWVSPVRPYEGEREPISAEAIAELDAAYEACELPDVEIRGRLCGRRVLVSGVVELVDEEPALPDYLGLGREGVIQFFNPSVGGYKGSRHANFRLTISFEDDIAHASYGPEGVQLAVPEEATD